LNQKQPQINFESKNKKEESSGLFKNQLRDKMILKKFEQGNDDNDSNMKNSKSKNKNNKNDKELDNNKTKRKARSTINDRVEKSSSKRDRKKSKS
jgi:hypothetical protein